HRRALGKGAVAAGRACGVADGGQIFRTAGGAAFHRHGFRALDRDDLAGSGTRRQGGLIRRHRLGWLDRRDTRSDYDLVAGGARREQRVTGKGIDGYRGQGGGADCRKEDSNFHINFLFIWVALCFTPPIGCIFLTPARRKSRRIFRDEPFPDTENIRKYALHYSRIRFDSVSHCDTILITLRVRIEWKRRTHMNGLRSSSNTNSPKLRSRETRAKRIVSPTHKG